MQIFHYGNLSASTVLIQPVDDHDLEEMETELNEIRKQGKADFQLIAVKVDNWNQDLSPWEASAVFGREGFGDGAGELPLDGFAPSDLFLVGPKVAFPDLLDLLVVLLLQQANGPIDSVSDGSDYTRHFLRTFRQLTPPLLEVRP